MREPPLQQRFREGGPGFRGIVIPEARGFVLLPRIPELVAAEFDFADDSGCGTERRKFAQIPGRRGELYFRKFSRQPVERFSQQRNRRR